MRVVTSEQMRRLDEATIGRFEPGLVLMERAGQGIFDSITDWLKDTSGECVSIFLGSGNNAGDGLVVARLLAGAGVKIVLMYMREPEKFSPDASKNYARLDKAREKGLISEVFLYLSDWKQKVTEVLNETSLVIDALLGTGISSDVKDDYREIIDVINSCGSPVVAVDIPSGVNGTSAEIMGSAVVADLTVTMGLPKTGTVFYPGKACSGAIEVVDIGIPDEVIEESGIDSYLLDIDLALEDLPRRDPGAHKFDCGSLLVIAGSRRYSGAAYLSAAAALRTGVGIVYLAAPESIRTVIQSLVPEIIFISLPETDGGSISENALDLLQGEIRYDAVAIGPGLTTDEETTRFVKKFVAGAGVPVLVDADGINSYPGGFSELEKASKKKEIIITPHSGELRRLAGREIPGLPGGRTAFLVSLVEGTGITLVHKGAPTVIAHPSSRIDINVEGHPGLATAGSGDVLTGAIAGFLAQGATAGRAARLGVYLHSRAADIAALDVGERGMIAGDCCDALPLAFRELEEENDPWRVDMCKD